MKHDHRQSIWIIGGGWLWCYRCGAIRPNLPGRRMWDKPTGLNGENPAMREICYTPGMRKITNPDSAAPQVERPL